MTRAWGLWLILLGSAAGCWSCLSGCTARQVAIADTIVTEACDEAIAKCGDCMASGKCDADQAQSCALCTHSACEEIRDRLWERVEDEQ